MPGAFKSHVLSAIVGGLVTAGGLIAFGVAGDPHTETIFNQAPVTAQASADPSSGLTAHDIYARYAPAVVFIRAKLVDQEPSPFNLFQARGSRVSTGSGFLIDHHGDILTDYHVIAGADRSRGVSVQFNGQRVRTAGVIAVDPGNDLAVLRIDARGLGSVIPLRPGDSSTVRVGDPTLTIGNPFGLDRTLTSGIVAALQHRIVAADDHHIDDVIQTDEPVAAGNAGGPLLDAAGRVIGVTSEVATGSSTGATGQQVGFAVPMDTVATVLARVAQTEAIHVAVLGVKAAPASASRSGALVGGVVAGGPAAGSGLQRGDVIERVDGVPVDSVSDALAIVSTLSPGQAISLQIRRAHRQLTLAVTLGSRDVASP